MSKGNQYKTLCFYYKILVECRTALMTERRVFSSECLTLNLKIKVQNKYTFLLPSRKGFETNIITFLKSLTTLQHQSLLYLLTSDPVLSSMRLYISWHLNGYTLKQGSYHPPSAHMMNYYLAYARDMHVQTHSYTPRPVKSLTFFFHCQAKLSCK